MWVGGHVKGAGVAGTPPSLTPPPHPPTHSFLVVVFPSLLATYLGQTAMILVRPETSSSAFWASLPSGAIYWIMVVVAVSQHRVSRSWRSCMWLWGAGQPFPVGLVFVNLPSTVLQTMAAIIASQALITGAFSIVQQVRVSGSVKGWTLFICFGIRCVVVVGVGV